MISNLRTPARAAATCMLASAFLFFTACGGDDDDATDPDAAPSIDAAESVDGPTTPDADTPTPDAGLDAAIPPSAPTVTAPVAAAAIASPVAVVGSAEAGAAIDVVVLDGSTEVGTGSATANGTGAFNLNVSYTNADPSDPLTVRVTQTSRGMTSDPTDVAVTQLAVFNLGGNISQADDGSSVDGTIVKVRLYSSATEVLDFVQEAQVAAVNGVILPTTPYTFQVPPGTYTVRAFRDSGGPSGPTPDGHPTMWSDPQVPGTTVVITTADSPANDLTLVRVDGGTVAGYHGFDVAALNSSFEPEPPGYYDVGLDEWVDGDGLCRGFYMAMYTETPGGNLSAPMVRLPSGADVEMLDDGGCGDVTHDNTSSSYDEQPGDNRFSRGIPSPTAGHAGDYVFYYRDTVADFVHSQVDNVATVFQLPIKVPITSPTGAAHNTDLTPTITWDAVANADSYVVDVWGSDIAGGGAGGYFNWDDPTREVTGTSYTPATGYELVDDEVYAVNVSPRVMDATVPNDVDAFSHANRSLFVTDTAGDSVMTISGAIANDSGSSGDLVGGAGSFDIPNFGDEHATLVLPAAATTYTMTVFLDPTCTPGAEEGYVHFGVDVDDSGDGGTSGNRTYRVGHDGLEMCGNLTGQDFTIRPPAVIVSPAEGLTGVGNTPTMQWEDYANTYFTATGVALSTVLPTWSYIWYAQSAGNPGMPQIIWGQPNSATSFDLGSPPSGTDKFDVLTLMATTSLTTLAGTSVWHWSLMVVACDYDEYVSGTASVYTDCVQALLDGQGAGTFASSPQVTFSTD